MRQTCPSCQGERVPDDPDALITYDHAPRCSLLLAEQETLAEDVARYRRFGTVTRHRPTTSAERLLLTASGVKVPESGELFTRVDWQAPDLRMRSWKRQPVVALDEVTP
jgi:hypothetical protein